MGKRTRNLTGLSRFVIDALKESESADTFQDHSAIAENSSIAAAIVHPASSSKQSGDKRPTKKRKTETTQSIRSRYDATGLVPYYRTASEVPDHLQKYFSQRERYFSLYDKGCLLDEEGWYSVTPEAVAEQIAERCRCDTILDAFCGVGGNTIAFAKTCERVIALDTNPTRLALARHNAAIYGVADRIEFILTDYLTFVQSYLTLPSPENRKIDVVFLSPPWGGPSYLSNSTNDAISQAMTYDDRLSEDALPVENYPEYSLSSIQPIHGAKLFQLSRQISRNIAYFLPRNSKLEEISSLLVDENSGESTKENSKETNNSVLEMVEVEEEWMGTKLKALTCYFGGLASGQEHLF